VSSFITAYQLTEPFISIISNFQITWEHKLISSKTTSKMPIVSGNILYLQDN